MKPETPFAWPWALSATFVAYVLLGWVAAQLAIPPGYSIPLFPSAGVALVSVLVWGWRMLPAVGLGGCVVSVLYNLMQGRIGMPALAVPAAIGIGAMLQAATGVRLVQRRAGSLLTLTEPRDLADLFLRGGALACLVSPSVATLAMYLSGKVPPSVLPKVWLTWWIGDTLGVLIGAPLAMTVIGRPRALWAARRRSVALPALFALALAAMAIVRARSWDEERAVVLFERDAHSVHAALLERLQDPLSALEAMRGLYIGSQDVTRSEFRRAAAAWLESSPALEAVGWSERVSAADIPLFEIRLRDDGASGTTVYRRGANGEHLAPEGREALPIRFVEPGPFATGLIGSDLLSRDSTRQAIETAIAGDRPSASSASALLGGKPNETGAEIYRAIYDDEVEPGAREAHVRGVLFVTVRTEETLAAVLAGLPDYLEACLLDASPSGVRRHLAGRAGCERDAEAPVQHASDLAFAGRVWQLRVTPAGGRLPIGDTQRTWLFAISCLLATATFVTLLLVMAGRARRIESAVEERTAALQREIDERTSTEAALRDSEQRLRNILDHVPIGVVYTDLNGQIAQSNPKFRQLVGYDAEELGQRRSLDLIHPEDRHATIEATAQLVRGEVAFYQRQSRYVRRDGKVLWVRAGVSLLRDEAGQPHRIVAVLEDIGEHLKLRDAENAREVAEAAARAKNEFLSRVGEHLRSPLQTVLGSAERIERGGRPVPPDERAWIDEIQHAASRMLVLVDDTLDLSRVESGKLDLRSEALDVASLMQEALLQIEPAARRRGIIVTHELASDAGTARGDAARVRQILAKLLGNAVRHNQDHGRIHFEARPVDDCVELVVSDTGPGMSRARVQALFQPAPRRGNAPSPDGGGVGLTISRRLAELMHGSLTVRSIEGEGSSFTLSLPRNKPREVPQPTGPDDLFDELTPGYRQRVVHYIEDNETNAVVMEGILAQRPQVKLRISQNGLDGLAAIRSRPPSMILLDMNLPDIDGLQLLRMLKDDSATASIPVVIVSADAVMSRIQAALEAGAEYYLTKPVNVAELLRLVDGVLEPRDTMFG